MKLKTTILVIIFTMIITPTFSQNIAEKVSDSDQTIKQEPSWRHHIGSSLFMGFNLLPDPADYYMLNYGYYLSQKDVIIVEAWTWTVYEPIGTYGDPDNLYPGKIISYGIGAGYQRFHWKNLYTTIEATPLVQQYYDSDDNKIQKGLQLYCQLITGYRFEFYNKRLFIEPALALKYWPVDTNYPESFAEIEEGTPNYIIEPSLILGFRL